MPSQHEGHRTCLFSGVKLTPCSRHSDSSSMYMMNMTPVKDTAVSVWEEEGGGEGKLQRRRHFT